MTTEIIKPLMVKAGIPEGAHRTSKGLRHAYGVNAVTRNIPLDMLQKWMGHSDIKTTAIYANAIGKEEAEIAALVGLKLYLEDNRKLRAVESTATNWGS